MNDTPLEIPALASAHYAVLRYGGEPAERAGAQLGWGPAIAALMEHRFSVKIGRSGPDAMRPRFARHNAHVAAVLARGGYPVMEARAR